MAMRKDVIKGLQIFEKYEPDEWLGGAEHDIIFGSAEIEGLSDEDRAELDTLGWFWSAEYDCWAIFT